VTLETVILMLRRSPLLNIERKETLQIFPRHEPRHLLSRYKKSFLAIFLQSTVFIDVHIEEDKAKLHSCLRRLVKL
jgi:hypothetical protein